MKECLMADFLMSDVFCSESHWGLYHYFTKSWL